MVIYAQINVLNRIISLRGEQADGLVEVDNPDIINNPQDYKYVEGGFVLDAPPSPYHSLNANGDWYLNNEVLQNAKNMMWERIKSYRDEREDSGVKMAIDTVNYWFHSDTKSLIKYIFLMIFASQFPNALKWKTLSGDKVTLSTSIIINLFFTILNYGGVVFEVAEQHKVDMQSASDPLNYNYTTGWPPIFGE